MNCIGGCLLVAGLYIIFVALVGIFLTGARDKDE